MKNSTYLQEWLFIGLSGIVLAFFLLFTPAPVYADSDPLDDFISVLQDVEREIGPLTDYGFQISADDLAKAKDTIQCLIDANGDSATANCLQEQKLIEQPDEINMFIDCYIYWMAGDYIGLAYNVGGDFVCAFLKVALSGIPVCDILEELAELVEGLYDAGKAVIAWLGEAGEDFVQALTDGYCWVVGCDNDTQVPPEVILFLRLQPYKDKALAQRESINKNAYDAYLSDLQQRILTQVNEEVNAANEKSAFGAVFPLYTPSQMKVAAKRFTYDVNTLWTNHIMNTENKNRQGLVQFYAVPAAITSFVKEVIDACTDAPCQAKDLFTDKCVADINIKQKFLHIDRWKDDYTLSVPHIDDYRKIVNKTYKVCQTFYALKKQKYQEKAHDYLVQQKICTESGSALVCEDLEKYKTCNSLMTAFGQQDACNINPVAVGKEALAKMKKRFRDAGSRFYPLQFQLQSRDKTITKTPPDAAGINPPEEFPCYRPTHEYYFKSFYGELFADLPGRVLHAVSKENPAYTKLRNKVKNTVVELKGNAEYTGCSFDISGIDPLLVEASSTFCLQRVQDNNDAPGFDFSIKVPKPLLTIDGRDTPLMFADLGGEMEKRFKKVKLPGLVDQKIDIAAPIERNQLNKLQFQGKALRTENLNAAKGFAPAARLTGTVTSAVKPGRSLQTPVAGQQVMSGNLPPGQQVAGKSLSSGIKAKKSSSVVKKQGGRIQKDAAMEVLPINSRNTTSRPVTIKIKNIPFSRIPFELRYRPGVGGFYKPVQHPAHRFSRANNLTSLSLDLKKPGRYQVRFKTSGMGPWGKWYNFTVAENQARLAGQAGKMHLPSTGPRAINPQPEPPGKSTKPVQTVRTRHTQQDKPVPAVSSKPIRTIRSVPVSIQSPRNGQKFLLTGNSVTIKVKVGNRGGQKLQIEIQQKKKGRYTTIRPVARQQQGHDLTTVSVAVKSRGEYRLRVKQMGKSAKWSAWRMFTVNTPPGRPVKLTPATTFKPPLHPVK